MQQSFCGFSSLVLDPFFFVIFGPRAGESAAHKGLLDVVRSEETEAHRGFCFDAESKQTLGHSSADKVEMGGFALDNTA